MAVGRSEGPQRKKQGDPHRQPERLFPDRVKLFGHRRAIDREWICSGMLDAGHDHGSELHFEPAWNNDYRITAVSKRKQHVPLLSPKPMQMTHPVDSQAPIAAFRNVHSLVVLVASDEAGTSEMTDRLLCNVAPECAHEARHYALLKILTR
jgi:hypothetical protein